MAEWMKRPSECEMQYATALRKAAVDEIHDIGPVQAADRLGLFADNVRRLAMCDPWSLEEAFRVGDALGLPMMRGIRQAISDLPA